jgi:threonine synthase
MKLLAEDSASFRRLTDPAYAAATSVVCRFRNVVRFGDSPEEDRRLKEYLLQCSIREGARVVELLHYKGVAIHLLDETSAMATGSLKSIDGCLTTSFCRLKGMERIAFESGGNTGSSFTTYGRQSNLETFFFCPLGNLDLLDSSLFNHPRTHLIGVEDRRQVKEMATLFAATAGMAHVPDKSWRNGAAIFRGLFILEHLLAAGKYDWLAQTVSAGFGPIGIYNVLQTFKEELAEIPRFLGIQQEANCPLFRAWKPNTAARIDPEDSAGGKLLTRIMYDETPQTYRTFEDMRRLLLETHGDLLTINAGEFAAALRCGDDRGEILDLLRAQKIMISLRSGAIIEKTGLIALAGTLKAINAGLIAPGSRVLCFLTSGVSRADGCAKPEAVVRTAADVRHYAETMKKGN